MSTEKNYITPDGLQRLKDEDVVVALTLPVLAMIPMMSTGSEERKGMRIRWLASLTAGAAGVACVALLLWKLAR